MQAFSRDAEAPACAEPGTQLPPSLPVSPGSVGVDGGPPCSVSESQTISISHQSIGTGKAVKPDVKPAAPCQRPPRPRGRLFCASCNKAPRRSGQSCVGR